MAGPSSASAPITRPDIIVFDLDYTLWPFWVDTHVTPPFQKSKGVVYDRLNKVVKCYPEVPTVLQTLKEQGYVLAVASRTAEVIGAKQLINIFGWDSYFTHVVIYPGSKCSHFKQIKTAGQSSYHKMLFFDDEFRNIREVSQLGVCSILVESGVDMSIVQAGLQQYADTRGSTPATA